MNQRRDGNGAVIPLDDSRGTEHNGVRTVKSKNMISANNFIVTPTVNFSIIVFEERVLKAHHGFF